MNCPSRNDDTTKNPHWNQSPPSLTADLTTVADLNGIANIREHDHAVDASQTDKGDDKLAREAATSGIGKSALPAEERVVEHHASTMLDILPPASPGRNPPLGLTRQRAKRVWEILFKYTQFIGPGFLIAVAYIDPGNYATDVNGQ